jgi:hypothetical protein
VRTVRCSNVDTWLARLGDQVALDALVRFSDKAPTLDIELFTQLHYRPSSLTLSGAKRSRRAHDD